MPTNLTADIYHGEKEVTLSDFAQRCAFATEVLGRTDLDVEAGLPDTFEPEVAELEARLAELRAQLEECEGWDEAAAEAASTEHFTGLNAYRTDYREAQKQLKERYKVMLTQVNEWKHPDTEDHAALKDLMVQQLKLSMEHDCRDPWGGKATKKLDGAEFKRHHIELAKEEIEKREAEIEDAKAEAIRKTEFVKLLKENLG